MSAQTPAGHDQGPLLHRAERKDRAGLKRRLREGAKRSVQVGTALFLLGSLWEIVSRLDPPWFPRVILPPVTEILPAVVRSLTTGFVWPHVWVTLQETLIAFVISASAAFVIGVFIALSPLVRAAVFPLVLGMQSTPRSALAPVMIAWFGFGISSKIALAVLIAFFPVLINTVAGLTTTGDNELLLMRSLEASKVQTFFYLRLPNAMPVIFPGLKASATFALVGAVFAELLGSTQGVGTLIKAATFQLRMDDVFAYLVLLSMLGISMVGLMTFIESKVTPWSVEEKLP